MKIAIDLDKVINSSRQDIEFFEILTHLLWLDHEIYILTQREAGTEQAVAIELDYLGIEYSHIVITGDKTQFLKENDISIFIEDEEFDFSAKKIIPEG